MAAYAHGAKPEDLTELYALVRQMKADAAQKEYAEALTAFQRECPQVEKTRAVNSRDGKKMYDFANLEDVDKAIRPLLTRYGIVLSVNPQAIENGVLKAKIRVRVGSYFEDSTLDLPLPSIGAANAAQTTGAAVSYARRMLICAALNVVCRDEDTDAHDDGELIDADQIEEIELLIRDCNADRTRFLKWVKAATVEDIPASKYAEAVAMLKAKKGGGR